MTCSTVSVTVRVCLGVCSGVITGQTVRCPWHGACFNIQTGDLEEYPGIDSLPCHKVQTHRQTGFCFFFLWIFFHFNLSFLSFQGQNSQQPSVCFYKQKGQKMFIFFQLMFNFDSTVFSSLKLVKM